MKIGVSTLTNTIYVGNTRIDKKGYELWTKKQNKTDECVKAVFEHMYNASKETGAFEYSIEGYGRMRFTREEKAVEVANG